MNDAAQIRRCTGPLRAIHPPLPAPDPRISNRESLRRVRADDSARRTNDVIDVTPTKQIPATHSNREGEALFSTAGGTENRAGLKARPYHGNGEQNSNRESRPSNREESHALQ